MLSLGLDLSCTASGVVALTQVGDGLPSIVIEHELKPKGLAGAERNRWIATEVMTRVHELKPDLIVLEGYGLNLQHPSSIVPLGELGGVIRFCLHIDGLSWFDPRPSEMKKFATGKGNANKEIVMLEVYKRWGFSAKTNNTADAYVAAAMGLAHAVDCTWANKEMKKMALGMVLLTK